MRFPTIILPLLVATSIVLAGVSRAAACPSGQYSSLGMCLPEIGGSVGSAFEHGKKELEAQLGGLPLDQWIVASRNTAINGSMPIPPQIRQELTGYASEDSMNRVRYKIGDKGFLNLPHVLEQGGFAVAVTLIDVVVFRGPSEASNPSIWAHELTHVDQYREWGVRDFAIRYARDYGAVEAPAYAKGNGYWAWARSHAVSYPGLSGGITLPPAPQAFGAFCYTPLGRFGPGPTQRLGAPCFVPLPGRPPLLGNIGP